MVERLARSVPLTTQGMVTMVDAADYAAVSEFNWYAHENHGNWYARRHLKIAGQWTTQYLHTFLTGWPLVDHEDGDGLNCRRNNMRKATVAENNRKQGLRQDNESGFKGVTWEKGRNRWRARIKINGREKTLKSLAGPPPPAPAPRELAEIYDRAAVEYFGEFARTNKSLGLLAGEARAADHELVSN